MLTAAILGWVAVSAGAQVNYRWQAQESWPDQTGHVGTDAVVWRNNDTGKNYVFVCGMLKVSSTASVIAVYKYEVVPDEAPPGTPIASYFFPDPVQGSPSGLSRAHAITLDPYVNAMSDETCDVYVVGETPVSGNGQDMVAIKLGYDLDPSSPQFPWVNVGHGPGVRTFNGTGSGNDYAVDVAVDSYDDEQTEWFDHRVYVLGTSPGVGGDDDIVTLKYRHNGALSATWGSQQGEGDGIRRYDGPGGGHDRAAELVVGRVVVPGGQGQEGAGWQVIVSGSADNNGEFDFVAINYGEDGSFTWNPGARLYDGVGYTNDVCTGLGVIHDGQHSISRLALAGYSEVEPPPSITSYLTNTQDTDYTYVRLDPASGQFMWSGNDPVRHWAGPGGSGGTSDFCWDAGWSPGPYGEIIWLTGSARHGARFDYATLNVDPSDGAVRAEHLLDYNDDRDDRALGLRTDDSGAVYVTGVTHGPANPKVLTLKLIHINTPPYWSLEWMILGAVTDDEDPDRGHVVVLADPGTGAPTPIVAGVYQECIGTFCYEQEP